MKPFLLLAILANPAIAQDTTMVAPVFSQIVASPLPQGFQPVFENADAQTYILEAVPTGESVAAWTQMVTVTGAKGKAGGEGVALAFANRLADGYKQACPDHFVAGALENPVIPGASEVFAAFLGCAAVAGAPAEAMVVLVMAGKEDVYTLQWAARTDASNGPVQYDLADWTPRLARLAAGTRLCDIVPDEAAPYPSCTGN